MRIRISDRRLRSLPLFLSAGNTRKKKILVKLDTSAVCFLRTAAIDEPIIFYYYKDSLMNITQKWVVSTVDDD